MSTTNPTDALNDCPPSAVLVYVVLEYEGPLTRGELKSETMLSKSTLQRQLNELTELGLVDWTTDESDARRRVYHIPSPK